MSDLATTATRVASSRDALATRPHWQKELLRARQNKKLVAGGVLVAALILVALFAPWIAPYPFDKMGAAQLYAPPSAEHWLGGDEFGRDLLSRVIYGARISLGISAVVTGTAFVVGGLMGLAGGLLGGRVDSVVSGLADLLFGVPTVLLALFAAAMFGTGLRTVVISLSIVYIPQFVRVVRGAALSVAHREFVTAAKATGASASRVALAHVLPNCMAPIIVQISLVASLVILDEAALSFIGVGTQPPTPSWGIILRQALDYLTRTPNPAIVAGASIFFAVFSFNLLADGLRDHLDPRLRGR